MLTNAFKCAEKYNTVVSILRRCSKQTSHENHPGTAIEYYYQRSLAVPFLDHLLSEIETRFTSDSLNALKSLSIVLSCFSSPEKATDDDFFYDDIDNVSTAYAELQLWCSYFKDKELPNTVSSSIQHTSAILFSNIRKMLIHAMVLSVT